MNTAAGKIITPSQESMTAPPRLSRMAAGTGPAAGNKDAGRARPASLFSFSALPTSLY